MAKKSGNQIILGSLPLTAAPPEDPSYQARVNVAKDKVKERTPERLAVAYRMARFGTDALSKELIAELRAAINQGVGNPVEIVCRMVIEAIGLEGVKALESEAQLRVTALEQLLADSQERGEDGWGAYGAKSNAVRLASGATVRIDKEPVVKVVDKGAYRQWCINNDLGEQLQLWPSTTASITKQRLVAGDPAPDGVVVEHFLTKVKFTMPGQREADETE